MTPTNPESRVAGIWREFNDTPPDADTRAVIYSEGIIEKFGTAYFQNGRWLREPGTPMVNIQYWLDESPEAIAEARQEKEVEKLSSINSEYFIEIDRLIMRNERLTAGLTATKAQRDMLLSEAKLMLKDLRDINSFVCLKAGVHPYTFRQRSLSDAIHEIENGGANGKG